MRCCTLHLFLALFLVTIAVGQADRANEPPPQSARNTAQDLAPEQKAKIELLAKLQKHFGKDLNSPGVELSLKEISRSRTDPTLIKYELYATGLPAESTYTLFQVPIDGSFVKTVEGVTLDKNGRALCGGNEAKCQGNSADDPIDLVVFAGIGEPKRFALLSEDKDHLKGFVSVIPFPNASSDNRCRLESIIGSPNGEVTYIQATGFEPNAELTMKSSRACCSDSITYVGDNRRFLAWNTPVREQLCSTCAARRYFNAGPHLSLHFKTVALHLVSTVGCDFPEARFLITSG
jgi:hypothetical protein